MSIGNPALGEVLSQHGSPHRLLAALAEWGILLAVRPDRSVVLGTTQVGDRVLLGYTSPTTYARHRGSHTLSACDAYTILDIQRVTGVREIVIDAAGPAAASVPIEDLNNFLRITRSGAAAAVSRRPRGDAVTAYATGAMASVSRTQTQRTQPSAVSRTPMFHSAPTPEGPSQPARSIPIPAPRPHLSGPMQQVDPGYRRTDHPILPALRVAIGDLLSDFPLIHHVWISAARTISGTDGIMMHVKVHSAVAEDIVRDLHRLVRARLPQLAASGAPVLMARVADANTERRMIELGAHVVCAGASE